MIKKLTLFVSALIVFCCITGFTTTEVSAESRHEAEPNNTKELAEVIQANKELPQDIISRDFSRQFIMNGETSSTDEDWFKVFLSEGRQTMTCNLDAFDFTIYDAHHNLVKQDSYRRTDLNPKAFWINIPTTGNYYVQIKGILPNSTKYLFCIGNPTYLPDKITVSSNPISVSLSRNSKQKTVLFDTSSNLAIPDKAIVYDITIGGLTSSSASDITVSSKQGSPIYLTRYSWSKSGLESRNMQAKNKWTADFTYRKDATFQPTMTLRYVYPVAP